MTDVHSCSYYCNRPECIKAQRDELRERLAQPEQTAKIDIDYWVSSRTQIIEALAKAGFTLMSNANGFWLQPAPQPEQEPDYWLGYGLQAHTEKLFEGATALYTTPPKRKPLTDERIGQIIKDCKITLVNYCSDDKQIEFARAIEAAHGIKENK